MSYNGCANYETWAVKLWLDNEEYSQRYWEAEAREALEESADEDNPKAEAMVILAENLESFLEANTPTTSGLYQDLLTAAIGEINYLEIAEAWLEDVEIEVEV